MKPQNLKYTLFSKSKIHMSRLCTYTLAACACLLALVGCGGGGGNDPVTGISATNFKYGQTATLTLTGNALDNVIKLSSDKCSFITLGAIESASTRHATCIVTATGPIQFTVKSNADYVVYTTTLTAPEPVTNITASNLKYGQTAVLTLSGDPQISALKVSADKCGDIVLDAVSTAATRTARCTVTGTGPLKFTVTNTSGTNTFYSQTVSVPEPQVTLVTTLGAVVVELNPTAAPITVKNFLSYVNQSPSFYNGTIFHRVLAGSVAQGGGYTSGFVAKAGLSSPITLEVGKGLSNLQGTIAMARTNILNSAQSQFFFNARDNVSYDTLGGGYAVFGKIISGLNLIIEISNLQATSERPNTEVTITSATQTQ
jgi:cyclophilin family peptidyl-prolyl cis-trans isomerase